MPRFDHSFNGVVEQNLQDTLVLKQRFLENKPKRPVKKSEKKPADNTLQNNISLPKFPKCSGPEDSGDNFNESSKTQQKHENLTKFSVEIVQQLEFTATSTNSQISTNVTVKALNTSVKGEVPNSPQSPRNVNLVECKQEPENIDFVDLEQCAAALEKDAAANGGNSFPGLSDLIGDNPTDAISSDTFKDLISEISEYSPELMMKEFDFNSGDCKSIEEHQKIENSLKLPVSCANPQQNLISQQRLCSSGLDTISKPELSPAAQTLKNMAEQHQHKTQMGISFNSRINQKPYEFQYSGTTEFVSQSVNQPNFKVSSPFSADNIKQESFSAQNSPVSYAGSPSGKTPSPQRMATQYKQVYQFNGQMSPQYRPQQTVKLDYSKGQVIHQPMISFSQAGMLQPMPPSGPMLRAPQPQYLPRYSLPMPRASYTKAPRLPQQEPTWMIQRPQQDFMSDAHMNQLQMSRVQQQLQMNQVRVHQSVSALSRGTSVPLSSSYTNANTSYAQSNFNMHQQFNQQSMIAPEFSLDFLEQLPHTDVTNFTDQELFSSLESGTNFSFPDIL